MGYEVTMYVVDATPNTKDTFVNVGDTWCHKFHDGVCFKGNKKVKLTGDEPKLEKAWVQKIASVGLGKMGDYPRSKVKASDYFFYDSDGNTPVVVDHYDEELMQLSVSDMIIFIKEQDSSYRRFKTALSVLESLGDDYNNPIVLLFGH